MFCKQLLISTNFNLDLAVYIWGFGYLMHVNYCNLWLCKTINYLHFDGRPRSVIFNNVDYRGRCMMTLKGTIDLFSSRVHTYDWLSWGPGHYKDSASTRSRLSKTISCTAFGFPYFKKLCNQKSFPTWHFFP